MTNSTSWRLGRVYRPESGTSNQELPRLAVVAYKGEAPAAGADAPLPGGRRAVGEGLTFEAAVKLSVRDGFMTKSLLRRKRWHLGPAAARREKGARAVHRNRKRRPRAAASS